MLQIYIQLLKSVNLNSLSVLHCIFIYYQDSLLDKHFVDGSFGEEELKDIGRPIKSLLVINYYDMII